MVGRSSVGDEQVEANRVWFAILFPIATSFVVGFILLAILTRDDLRKEPVLSIAAVGLISLPLTLPALVVNAIAYRQGNRTRSTWFLRGVITAVPITLFTLAILAGLFKFIRMGMAH
jgi:hypothetical protein